MAYATTHALRMRLRATDPARNRVPTVGPPALTAAGLGAGFVLSVGLTDGGYYGRASDALTGAFAAVAALGAMRGMRVSRGGVAALGALVVLAAWTALSATWAAPGALVEQEVRRTLVYASALAAVLLFVEARHRRAFLVGLLAGISLLAAVAIGIRATSGEVVDRFYGTLLEEPVGYPNALGALAALGVVIGLGLHVGRSAGRTLRGAAALLVLVLGLTGSRGAALALAVGLGALAVLGPRGSRLATATRALVIVLLGSAAWGGAVSLNVGGGWLVAVAVVTTVGAALAPDPGGIRARGALAVLIAFALLAAATLLVIQPVAPTSSFRTSYWAAALDEARAHPLLGSGAGSFHLTFAERGPDGMFARDAHSLYVEALSELGPAGLVVVVGFVTGLLAAAFRTRGDPLAAAAGAAFVVYAVHVGLDWDWEMPVVTLVGIGCAGVLLACGSSTKTQTVRGAKT